MGLFHRHRWLVDRKEEVVLDRKNVFDLDWWTSVEIGRIDRCQCGQRRAFLISATRMQPVNVSWLEHTMGAEARES